MDRIIEYPMEQIIVDDFLNQRVLDMIALGKLISALLGTQTMVEGLACTPTSPASMSVNVAPGQIFFLEAVDTTTYGDLSATANIIGHSVTPANTTIMKQGMILSETTFALTAPSTSGDSVNYLISANYEDSDAVNTVLNYYNSSNPSQPFQGPNNSGTAQPTVRQGKCVLTLTAGTAAPTGTQTTPEVPSGQIGLWVITVPYGATSITSSNISAYSGAPFLTQKLFGLMNESVPLTIPNATANNNPVALGQFLITGENFTTATASFTFTAPSTGVALVCWQYNSDEGVTTSYTNATVVLSGTKFVYTGTNQIGIGNDIISVASGASVTCALTSGNSTDITVTIVFLPTA
ncbi:hypothetical protein [Leptospirillum ferriphilum]|uniref:Uncharacterized protein n=1 Tax=Leptospirillum ferriphilum (strain ML-04) TaxID=1048260 RepID=J9Z8T7_LEPFM|nr:hypothetical protein [Leptospirillum ferriphilum]AFS52910.1 hypothetical protein LFML04_0675 [Leptospirillum ferriphilum ML-04]